MAVSMMSSQPNVIFNLKAHLPRSVDAESLFYRCKSSKNIVGYICRENAVNEKLNSNAYIDDACAVLDVNKKNIMSYMNNRPGSTGAFNGDKYLKEDDLEQYKKKLSSTDSIVWSAIVSFTPEISSAFCKNKHDAKELINTNLKNLFKDTPYDIDNIDWFGSYHTNTDNAHIHLVFFEKEKTKISLTTKKLSYNNQYKLPIDSVKNFTAGINRNFDPYKFPQHILRDEVRHNFNLYCNSPSMLLNFASKHLQEIKAKGDFQYAKLNSQDKKTVDNIVKSFIQNDKDSKEKYDSYHNFLLNYQAHSIKMFKNNNYKTIPKNVSSFYDNRMNEFNNRLGNTFLKILKNYDQLLSTEQQSAQLKKNNAVSKYPKKQTFAMTGALVLAAKTKKIRAIAAAQMLKTLLAESNHIIKIDLDAFYKTLREKESNTPTAEV